MIGAMVWIGNLKSPLVGDRDLDKLALSRIYGRVRRYQSLGTNKVFYVYL